MKHKRNRNDSGSHAIGMAGAFKRFLWGASAAMLLIVPFAKVALAQVPILPLQVSTNPGNGDQNPYGVAFVPSTFPNYTVQPGDVLL